MSKTKTIEALYADHVTDFGSKPRVDYKRVVSHDEDGNEYVTWEPIDYASYQKSLGFVGDWSLDSLLKAGINPNFPIHTGSNTRLEGITELENIAAYADTILNENNELNNE